MTIAIGAKDESAETPSVVPDPFMDMLRDVWGFDTLRPPQIAAISSILEHRDTLVVMPTGGGKSLCYQAPAVFRGGLTVVISPLLALMKDQVDSLKQLGICAVRIDSSLTQSEKREAARLIQSRQASLLFVSPERMLQPEFIQFLAGNEVHTFAIDEAHCVSQWGHDFRPEYRQLSILRQGFPKAAFHAFTATATEKVQRDIVEQLQLNNPRVLVSSFDRPNLTYRVLPQLDSQKQILDICSRHPREGGIVYCMRRNEVETIAKFLQDHGLSVIGYHAGMSNQERKSAQEAFISESVDIVVATVAFGMGIDRSNVRYVIHASIPRSIEHYQQETGRAGRDGLPAECVLLYSAGDAFVLRKITEQSLVEAGASLEVVHASRTQIDEMSRYCRSPVCRHQALVKYFGQHYALDNCGACDTCLGDTDLVPDAKIVAQKILSCVFRLRERFGVNYVVEVLVGSKGQNVLQRKHDQLSTYGLMREISKPQLRDWVYQLVGQGFLELEGIEYPILKLNAQSKAILFGDAEPRLIRTAVAEKKRKTKSPEEMVEQADMDLFQKLKNLRRNIAREQNVPPFVVFSDNTLLDMAAQRPTSLDAMLHVSGVGRVKLDTYGQQFLEVLQSHGNSVEH